MSATEMGRLVLEATTGKHGGVAKAIAEEWVKAQARVTDELEPLLAGVEGMVSMLESREWAEHSATIHRHPLNSRLETAITNLSSELNEANDLASEAHGIFIENDGLTNDFKQRLGNWFLALDGDLPTIQKAVVPYSENLLQRADPELVDLEVDMVKSDTGDWVEYREHLAVVGDLIERLNEVHSWIVCAAIATPADLMANATRIERITNMSRNPACMRGGLVDPVAFDEMPASKVLEYLTWYPNDSTKFCTVNQGLLHRAAGLIEYFRKPQQYIMSDELREILGTVCFQCISLAQIMRASGEMDIKTRAEDEQATVILWKLNHWLKHGNDWRTHATNDLYRMSDKIKAIKANDEALKAGKTDGAQEA